MSSKTGVLKFKVWHKKDKKFYPVIGISYLFLETIIDCVKGYDVLGKPIIETFKLKNEEKTLGNEEIVVEIFTGAYDVEGKEIWTSDIVSYWGERYSISFSDFAFNGTTINNFINKNLFSWQLPLTKIIGNIHKEGVSVF